MCSIIKILLTCASVVVGLLLLIASALAINEYQEAISKCFKKDDKFWILLPDTTRTEGCKPFFALTAVIAAGFLASAIQLLGCLYAFVKKDHGERSWRSFHAFIFLLTLVSFGVGIYYFGDAQKTLDALQHFQEFRDQEKKTLLNAAHGIDWIFCLVVIILASCLPAEHQYARPGA